MEPCVRNVKARPRIGAIVWGNGKENKAHTEGDDEASDEKLGRYRFRL